MTSTASLDPDGLITLTTGAWSERLTPEQLPSRIRLYRGLWAGAPRNATPARLAQPGPHARHYEATLRALEAIAMEVGQ